MSITKRVEKLEGQAPSDQVPSIIFIVGQDFERVPTGECINGVAQFRPRLSEGPPTSFFAYCLHHDCDAKQHTPYEGETFAEFEVRMDREHEEEAA